MPKKKQRRKLSNLAPHPRYGVFVRESGTAISEAELRRAYWGYARETVFPESAIRADTTRQNFSVFPREFYVDILKECRDCRRSFLFFAEEQRYWYEILRFYIDADCVRCCECRKEDQATRRRLERHAALVNKQPLTVREAVTLAEGMLCLWRDGVIRDIDKLGRVKNLAVATIPTNDVTRRIVRLAAEARAAVEQESEEA